MKGYVGIANENDCVIYVPGNFWVVQRGGMIYYVPDVNFFETQQMVEANNAVLKESVLGGRFKEFDLEMDVAEEIVLAGDDERINLLRKTLAKVLEVAA